MELAVAGIDQPGADVLPEPDVAPRRVRVPGLRPRSALIVFGGRVVKLLVIDPGTGEVRLLVRGGSVVVVELLVDEVEDERGVDDPDAGGEVLSAVVHERVAAVAGAIADLSGDADLQRPRLGAGRQRVELGVETVGLAAEDRGDLPLLLGAEVLAGVSDLLGRVEYGAVV